MKFIDNSDKVLKAFEEQVELGLRAIGMQAETYAKENLQRNPQRVDTGRLRNSITNKVVDNSVYIGTNVEYAPYVEYGTGPYAEGGGRKDIPWYYEDENGEGHLSYGMKPNHFLRDSASKHTKDYENIMEMALKGK